jgi:hypothetical protein
MISALWRAIQSSSRASNEPPRSPSPKIEADGNRDADRGNHREHGERDGFLSGRDVRLHDGCHAGDRQNQVLRVESRQDDSRSRRLQRRELVHRLHPLRGNRLLALTRSPAPLSERQPEHDDAEHELEPAHPARRLVVFAGMDASGDQQHDRPRTRDTDDLSAQVGGPVDPAAWGHEHQHDCDDRDRADRHPDSRGEHVADRLAHFAILSHRRGRRDGLPDESLACDAVHVPR